MSKKSRKKNNKDVNRELIQKLKKKEKINLALITSAICGMLLISLGNFIVPIFIDSNIDLFLTGFGLVIFILSIISYKVYNKEQKTKE